MNLSTPDLPTQKARRPGASRPAALRMAAGALLLLVLLAPAAAGQVPVPREYEEKWLNFIVVCESALVRVDYNGAAETPCVVRDIGKDSLSMPGSGSGNSVSPHTLFLEPILPENATGWQVIPTKTVIPMYGGDIIPFDVGVKATPLINSRDLHFQILATYHGPNGYTTNKTLPFVAEVNPYDFAVVSLKNQAQKAGQDEIVRYEVVVQNTAVYPDSYRFKVKGDPDLKITIPPNLYVPPGEERSTFISVLTPKGKPIELGRSTAISIKVESVTGTGVYSTTGILGIEGPYISKAWIPLTLIGLISSGILVNRTRERSEMRRLEKGRPRRVEPTPRQAVLLKQLKKRDPEAYKAKMAALAAIYAERRKDYQDHRKERLAADRAEAKQARAEFKAEKKRRKAAAKAQRKQEKIDAKLQRKEAKKQRKIDRVEAKQRKKQLKALNKKKAKLEKKQAKLQKKQAKQDAKLAKAQARAEKKAARQAAREAKRAKKQGDGNS